MKLFGNLSEEEFQAISGHLSNCSITSTNCDVNITSCRCLILQHFGKKKVPLLLIDIKSSASIVCMLDDYI